IVFVLAIVPPDVIWKINMFAFGGLQTAFLWVMVMGLFWKRANKTGALLSMAGGTLAYCAAMATGFKVADLHQIVIGAVV
ncbi:MAG: sodium/panthothenate symporter, partial [Gordonibacter sp.]